MAMSRTPSSRRSRRVLVPAVVSALALTLTAGLPARAAPPAQSPALAVRTLSAARGADVRVGSFNVQSVSLDATRGNQRPWHMRRGTVIGEILDERLDVIGVQEAAYSMMYKNRLVDGVNQYLDLRNGLNKAGGHYQLTNKKAVNCVRPYTSYKCVPRDQDASRGERILYNTSTLTLLRRNSMRYKARLGNRYRFLTWGVFRSKRTHHTFLFASTHLDPRDRSVRTSQWWEMIRKLRSIRGHKPVISVGDFNAQKFDVMTRRMLPAMRNNGFGDVLNQQYRVNPTLHVRAEKRIHGWMNTYNHLSRRVSDFGYTQHRNKTGNGIDYIFASNRLRVKDYKVVCHYNHTTMRVVGTMPSDHNLIRATITIP